MKANAFAYDLFNSSDYYLVCYGGAGSGKSRAAAQKIIIRLLSEKGHRYLALRKVARTMENSVIAELLAAIRDANLEKYFHYSKSRPWGITCLETGSCVLFAGLDDREKLKSFSGITGAWIEEATELDENDLTEIVARIRGITPFYKQIMITFNPTNVEHWIYRRFFGEFAAHYESQSKIIHTNYKNNAFIDSDYVHRLNAYSITDPNYYRVYCLGEWGTTEEIIYKPFNVTNWESLQFTETWYGLDFGWNAPSACVKVGVYEGKIYVSEVFYGSKMDNRAILKALHDANLQADHPIYCDSADPKAIHDIRNGIAGMDGLYARPADKHVSEGIRTIQQYHSAINIKSDATNLLRESMIYQWRRGTRGELLDEPVKANDHALDALRYAIHSHFKTIPEAYRAEIIF